MGLSSKYWGEAEGFPQNLVELGDSAVLNNKASGAVRCRHPPQARPGGGALPTPSEPRGSYTRKRRDVPADDAPGRPFTARPAPPPCHEPPRTRGSVRQDSCLFSTDPRPRHSDRPVGRRRRLRGLPGRTDGGRPDERPQAHRKAGLNENGLASHLDHRSRPHRNAAATATDAGQPALGRAATTRGPATPDAIPAGQGCDRGAARRSRVLVE